MGVQPLWRQIPNGSAIAERRFDCYSCSTDVITAKLKVIIVGQRESALATSSTLQQRLPLIFLLFFLFVKLASMSSSWRFDFEFCQPNSVEN
jgi:hypothetical protein